MRREVQENQRFPNKYELVLQTYAIPMSDLVALTPALDPTKLKSIKFVFDRAVAGTVLMDDVGLWVNAPAAFFAAKSPVRDEL